MEIFGITVPIWAFIVVVAVLLAVGFWRMSRSENDDKPRPDEWQPDVDKEKAAAMRNHNAGPDGAG